MLKFIKSLYVHPVLFYYFTLIIVVFLVSFWFPALYTLAWVLLYVLVFVFALDIVLLYKSQKAFKARRILPEKFSNSDENPVFVSMENRYAFRIGITMIDEIPVQFQKRDFNYKRYLENGETYKFTYYLRPVERGEYHFGDLIFYISSPIRIIARRYNFQANDQVAVYPSYIQMRKYEFLAMSNRLMEFGLKKIRRLGHSMEFEQIKNYVIGDDIRSVNWKATAKRGQLMVNQYQDEKSQPIYSIIDLGRVMKMPFEELKLLDYAINSTLAFSNIALLKNDKAGLLTFSKKVEKILPASNKRTHLNLINETLYNIETKFTDSDFGLLYAVIKRKLNQRSLLLLYTNFEHIASMRRQLPFMQALSKKHIVVCIFFENTELDILIQEPAKGLQSIYDKTIAEKFSYEKKLMVKELENHGIHAILSKPKNLSVQVINKYLAFKARGII